MTNIGMRQFTGIILLAAGWGWAGANFAPSDVPWWNYLLHTIPVLLVLVLGAGFFRAADAQQRGKSPRSGAAIGLSIFAAISFTGFIAGIIMGVINPDPNAYGITTLADLVSATIVLSGALVWLTTLLPNRRSNVESSTASRV